MRELALNILDIAENSVKAGAKLIAVTVTAKDGILTVRIDDDGCGMDPEFAARVLDPFTTTRTTRKVGMGLPLFKMAAEMAGGELTLVTEKGKGTSVTATFVLSHIDRAPLGDLAETAVTLLADSYDLVLTLTTEQGEYVFDSRELKSELDGISVTEPEITVFVRDMISENITAIGGNLL